MKTKRHGNGLTHKQAIQFSNRLASAGYKNCIPVFNGYQDGFNAGWEAACRYFAHELRLQIRYYEQLNEI